MPPQFETPHPSPLARLVAAVRRAIGHKPRPVAAPGYAIAERSLARVSAFLEAASTESLTRFEPPDGGGAGRFAATKGFRRSLERKFLDRAELEAMMQVLSGFTVSGKPRIGSSSNIERHDLQCGDAWVRCGTHGIYVLFRPERTGTALLNCGKYTVSRMAVDLGAVP